MSVPVPLAEIDAVRQKYGEKMQECQERITKYSTFKRKISIGSLTRWIQNDDDKAVDSIFSRIGNFFVEIDQEDYLTSGTPPSFISFWEDIEKGSYLVSVDASVSCGHCFGGSVIQSSAGDILDFSHAMLENVIPSTAFYAEVHNLFRVVDWLVECFRGKSGEKKIILKVDRLDMFKIVRNRNPVGKSVDHNLASKFRDCFEKLDAHFEVWKCIWVPRSFNRLADYMSKYKPYREPDEDRNYLINKHNKYKRQSSWFFPGDFYGFQKIKTKSKKHDRRDKELAYVLEENNMPLGPENVQEELKFLEKDAEEHEELSKREEEVAEGKARLNKLEVDNGNLVDRRIVINLIVNYLKSNHSKDVLHLMVKMLGFSDEEKRVIL